MDNNNEKLENLRGALLEEALSKQGDERKALVGQILDITKVQQEERTKAAEIRQKDTELMNSAAKTAADQQDAKEERILRAVTWAMGGIGTFAGGVLMLTKVIMPFERGDSFGSMAGKAVANQVLKKFWFK